MSRIFYTEAADALVGFLPRAFRGARTSVSARNLKVWFDEPREHYEIQTVGRRVLEIGFHAEHPAADANDTVVERLLGRRASWRKTLAGAEAGAFLGAPRPWRRLSETWEGAASDEPGAAVEAAERLAAYIKALEPVRRAK
jgi:hypothetical protein